PIGRSGFRLPRRDEPSGSQNQLRSCFPVLFQIHLVHAGPQRALAVTDTRHINREAVASDAKFLTSAKVRCDLRTVDDVLAWQARDVRARSANVFALDDCDTLSLPSKGPRSDGRSRAATENHQIESFRLRL